MKNLIFISAFTFLSPRSRRAGMPMITPNRAASRPASTREIGKEIGRAMPTFLVKSAEA